MPVFAWITDPAAWVALITLTVLEIVLGIDNVIFISLLVQRLGKAAAKDIQGAKLVELDNVGHIPHLEAPDRFHKALLYFLQNP